MEVETPTIKKAPTMVVVAIAPVVVILMKMDTRFVVRHTKGDVRK
jgi:hypothetical protein